MRYDSTGFPFRWVTNGVKPCSKAKWMSLADPGIPSLCMI